MPHAEQRSKGLLDKHNECRLLLVNKARHQGLSGDHLSLPSKPIMFDASDIRLQFCTPSEA